MSYTASEQELYDFARASLPPFFFEVPRDEEEMGAFVKIFDAARSYSTALMRQSLILEAANQPPDWLNQHARDRGLGRQSDESNANLRDRIRGYPDAINVESIRAAAQAVVDAAAVSGDVAIVELARDRAFFQVFESDSGVGGEFTAGVGTNMRFEPTVRFDGPPYRGIAPTVVHALVVSGAASAGNDGDFGITGLVDDAAEFPNASGVVEADPTVAWTVEKRDENDEPTDGFRHAYLGRGYRMSSGPGVVIILPYGCDAATEASVREMLRQKKGAGVRALVETRLVP